MGEQKEAGKVEKTNLRPRSFLLISILSALVIAVCVSVGFFSYQDIARLAATPAVPVGVDSEAATPAPIRVPASDGHFELTLLKARTYDTRGQDEYDLFGAGRGKIFIEMSVKVNATSGNIFWIPLHSFVVIEPNGEVLSPLDAHIDREHSSTDEGYGDPSGYFRLEYSKYLKLIYAIDNYPHDVFLQIRTSFLPRSPLIYYRMP